MDTITHVLTGGVIAKAIDDEKIGNWGTIAGLAMGFFPDSDFILGLFNRQFYLEYHRDFTPLESPAACSGDEPRKTSGLLRGEDIIPSGPEAF
jgi:membrane-bound metal-dependent hydrolase YbcI (DUF457 family)